MKDLKEIEKRIDEIIAKDKELTASLEEELEALKIEMGKIREDLSKAEKEVNITEYKKIQTKQDDIALKIQMINKRIEAVENENRDYYEIESKEIINNIHSALSQKQADTEAELSKLLKQIDKVYKEHMKVIEEGNTLIAKWDRFKPYQKEIGKKNNEPVYQHIVPFYEQDITIRQYLLTIRNDRRFALITSK